MFPIDQYQLLDFGNGRRLERFGPVVLDRPCPVAEHDSPADSAAWQQADARFDRTDGEEGRWTSRPGLPERWMIADGRIVLELKRTEFGHLGVFPEQAENWDWIVGQIGTTPAGSPVGEEDWRLTGAAAPSLQSGSPSGKPDGVAPAPLRVLNLFAYTGGSTLAAAAAGAEVTHVDAAKNIAAWARRNAELSGLADRPIHWIVEDAMKFAKRELRRGNQYDAVILDPPSYGHGPHGEVWRLATHLPRLLKLCGQLTAGRRRFMLLSCHTPGFGPERLRDIMADALGDDVPGELTCRHAILRTSSGRELPVGVVLRWTAGD